MPCLALASPSHIHHTPLPPYTLATLATRSYTTVPTQLLGICDLFEEDHARLRVVFHAKSHAKEDVQRAIELFPRTVGEVRMLLGEDM